MERNIPSVAIVAAKIASRERLSGARKTSRVAELKMQALAMLSDTTEIGRSMQRL